MLDELFFLIFLENYLRWRIINDFSEEAGINSLDNLFWAKQKISTNTKR